METSTRPIRPTDIKEVHELRAYELAGEWNALDELLTETLGELTPEIERLLDELQGTTTDKLEKVALVAQRYANNAKAIDLEIERLVARRTAQLNASKRLKDYAGRVLDAIGQTGVKGVLASIGWQNNAKSVAGELTESQLRDLAQRRPELVRIIPEQVELNRRAALEWADTPGNFLPAGLEVVRGRHIRIR